MVWKPLDGCHDTDRILRNPHKGWYQHYYDNTIEKYLGGDLPGDFLMDFPGLNHIYLRLAWAYLEPLEGSFRWNVLDEVIEAWVAKGYTVSFRISCKETDAKQVYATPEWVKDAGCQGRFTRPPWGGPESWEPDYGDPIFLEKLDNFHKAFAERYDGKPWVEYIDVGSFGDWGEGHTWAGSQLHWPINVLRQHLAIHEKHYAKSLLVTNYGFMYNGHSFKQTPETKAEWMEYFVDKGYAIRNDSIGVKSYSEDYGPSTLQDPHMFDAFWPTLPVILELEHYGNTLESGAWKGGEPLELAMELSHATFIGHHGYARQFLRDNPDLADKLANRVGYWYFPKGIGVPETLLPGQGFIVDMEWENRGVAPAYHKYRMELILHSETGKSIRMTVPGEQTDNREWAPDSCVRETYSLILPDGMEPGKHTLGIRLSEESEFRIRPVELGLKETLRMEDGTYLLTEVTVA